MLARAAMVSMGVSTAALTWVQALAFPALVVLTLVVRPGLEVWAVPRVLAEEVHQVRGQLWMERKRRRQVPVPPVKWARRTQMREVRGRVPRQVREPPQWSPR